MRGFGVGPMTTCRCCGQLLRSGDESVASEAPSPAEAEAAARRTSIDVDDALLELCNRAHEEAEHRGHGAVEISHLVAALAAASVGDDAFEQAGLSRRELALAADRTLALEDPSMARGRPRTSAELRVLLIRAEAHAKTQARRYATPADLLWALAVRSRDLVSARFVPDALSRTHSIGAQAAQRHLSGAGWREPRQQRFDFEARRARASDPSCHHIEATPECHAVPGTQLGSETAGADELQALGERMTRQELLLARLTELVSHLAQNTTAARQSAPDGLASATSAAAGSILGISREPRSHAPARTARGPERLLLRRRTLIIGRARQGARAAASADGASEGMKDGLLRLVSRSGGSQALRRGRPLREPGAELDDPHGTLDHDGGDEPDGQNGDRMKRFYLSPGDDIVKAPSIGPRTAARLIPAGLVLVRDLLVCDPADVAARVGARYITADRIADWKAQARLVCTIPWLRGTHAQLLVGAGYDTIGKLQRADASNVCAAILRFAATREGQSILRSGPPPEIDRIACWIENTALAEPARAA